MHGQPQEVDPQSAVEPRGTKGSSHHALSARGKAAAKARRRAPIAVIPISSTICARRRGGRS